MKLIYILSYHNAYMHLVIVKCSQGYRYFRFEGASITKTELLLSYLLDSLYA